MTSCQTADPALWGSQFTWMRRLRFKWTAVRVGKITVAAIRANTGVSVEGPPRVYECSMGGVQ